ncbi:MAG: hypothetical protein HKN04_08595 [Rhodothermaceae bacterium]|nr:hypothetical protein [Rhodothermaceae bacterium]
MPDRPFDPFVPPTDDSSDETPVLQSEAGSEVAEDRDRAERSAVRIPLLVVGLMAVFGAFVLALSQANLFAAPDGSERSTSSDELPLVAFDANEPFSFNSLDIHPDKMFSEFFGGAFLSDPTTTDSLAALEDRDFQYRLDMYEKAYGVDDNFTIRVLDERTGETLEVFTLRDLRAQYEATGQMNWDHVDFPNRRNATTALRQKWTARGIPREAITIRWGRANQTLEARQRDEATIQYEVQLARRLGLSLLSTEIGTVETFNQDHLISSANAQSRYQLMPDIMELFDVERYMIPTTAGSSVAVKEQLHPLLSMEPSLMLVRAYSNSVGHELPGVSAYHTGPGNIFRLYQAYLRANAARPSEVGHVSDAYMWGITDGFERVDAQSSFGPQSRAYVMKAYGSLRATEGKIIDPSQSLRVDRVQIRTGQSITLDRLLTALSESDRRLDWGTDDESLSLYDRFRALNPHIELPVALTGGVPERGNLRLTATADGKPLRFFVPPGTDEILRRVGLDVIGDVFSFDENTYAVAPEDITSVDRAYAQLVEDTGDFGFTMANKARLDRIASQLASLAEQNPTRFRQTQAKIARIHRGVWGTRAFRDLAGTVETLLTIVPERRALEALAQDSVEVVN